jgi:hypothetical protein
MSQLRKTHIQYRAQRLPEKVKIDQLFRLDGFSNIWEDDGLLIESDVEELWRTQKSVREESPSGFSPSFILCMHVLLDLRIKPLVFRSVFVPAASNYDQNGINECTKSSKSHVVSIFYSTKVTLVKSHAAEKLLTA